MEGAGAPASSWFVWNEVLFASFQAGYLKRLDWDLYCSLTDPVAKRLYRLLDKRFYHRDRVVFDLEDLALNKVRVSRNYNTAQIKRALQKGIRELEAVWELQALEPERRFSKVRQGKWEVVFTRKARRNRAEKLEPVGLERELVAREVSREIARELVQGQPEEKVRGMIELFDWHRKRGEAKGPGFLVAAIQSEGGYTLPAGFTPQAEKEKQKAAENSRKQAERDFRERKEAVRVGAERVREGRFLAFWEGLEEAERRGFWEEALGQADETKRAGYRRCEREGSPLLESYRAVILRDHFWRTNAEHPGEREGAAIAAAVTE